MFVNGQVRACVRACVRVCTRVSDTWHICRIRVDYQFYTRPICRDNISSAHANIININIFNSYTRLFLPSDIARAGANNCTYPGKQIHTFLSHSFMCVCVCVCVCVCMCVCVCLYVLVTCTNLDYNTLLAYSDICSAAHKPLALCISY